MKRIETVEITRIRTRNRIRREDGDLTELMESMRRHGLLNPLTVTESDVLVAGKRRLEAARRLGWTTIQCRIVPDDDEQALLEMEIDENVTRKEFTSDEMADAFIRLERIKNPGWWRSFLKWLRKILAKIGFRRNRG